MFMYSEVRETTVQRAHEIIYKPEICQDAVCEKKSGQNGRMPAKVVKEQGFEKKPLPLIIEMYMIPECRKKSTCRINETRRVCG
jgi:hypothetical protein